MGDTVFGRGAERGIRDRFEVLKRDVDGILTSVQGQVENLKNKMEHLSDRIKDTNNLVTAQMAEIRQTQDRTADNKQTITKMGVQISEDVNSLKSQLKSNKAEVDALD